MISQSHSESSSTNSSTGSSSAPVLSVREARVRVLAAVSAVGTEDVLVGDALGRILAEELVAPHPLPRFDNSAMDGYAVRADDIGGDLPIELMVVGEVKAGDPGEVEVGAGEAARIMTGAPIPPGATAVVPVEDTEEASGRVLVKAAPPGGGHIRPAGEDVTEGQVLARPGTPIGPGELALIASLGLSPLSVYRRPRVAIVVTGDELVTPEEVPGPGQIRDSNSVALTALVHDAGGEPIVHRSVPDGLDETRAAFSVAAEGADLVISSGGVSMGRYDFVRDVIGELGRIDLWRVAMQPGKPVVLGAIGDVPFLGLPGNPVSIHIGFEQFVRPALRKMQGMTSVLRPTVRATLSEPLDKRPGRLHFVRVTLGHDGEGWIATPTGLQGSHIQSSLLNCHGVARFDIDEAHLDAGAEVTVEVWSLPAEETA